MMSSRAVLAAVLLLACNAWAETTIEDLVRDAGLVEGPVAVRDLPGWSGAGRILTVRVSADEFARVRELFPDIEFVATTGEDDAVSKASDVVAILGSCSARLVEAAPKLVWVQVFSAGVERCLTVPQIVSGDVLLTNMQKMSSPVIGEHAIAMALALARHLPAFARQMPDGLWARGQEAMTGMTSLDGKTMLVLGLGGIGTEVARRGAALGMRVVGTRNSRREGPDFVDYVGLSHEMLDLVRDADVIVNALPLTNSTRGVIDEEFFGAAKKGAFFINIGRGATVVTDALLAALESGHLGGAGLDVTEPEPLPRDHPLWQLENVIITPHVAWSGGARLRHVLLVDENLRRYLAGDALLNVVDPEKGY